MDDDDVYFFVHVMKTGGTSFIHYLQEVVGKERAYPVRKAGDTRPQLIRKRILLAELCALSAAERASLRAYSGHFPAFAAEIVRAAKTVTVLREPVARTISMLTQRQRRRAPDKSLVEIYEDPMVFSFDRARLDAAKERLASIDVVGVQERYDRFLMAVQDMAWDRELYDFALELAP